MCMSREDTVRRLKLTGMKIFNVMSKKIKKSFLKTKINKKFTNYSLNEVIFENSFVLYDNVLVGIHFNKSARY